MIDHMNDRKVTPMPAGKPGPETGNGGIRISRRQRWCGVIEVDTTPRTPAQDRAWSEFWKDALAEARRRLAAFQSTPPDEGDKQ